MTYGGVRRLFLPVPARPHLVWKRVRECVFCPKGENLNSLSVSPTGYTCFRCNRSGSFTEYEQAKAKYAISPPTSRATPQKWTASPSYTENFNSAMFGSLPLLGEILRESFLDSPSSRRRVTLISGLPGVGKTTLLSQLCQRHPGPTLLGSTDLPVARVARSFDMLKTKPPHLIPLQEGQLDKLLSSAEFAHQALQVNAVFVDGAERLGRGTSHVVGEWRRHFALSPDVHLVATVNPWKKSSVVSCDSVVRGEVLLLLREQRTATMIEVWNAKGVKTGEVEVAFRRPWFVEINKS